MRGRAAPRALRAALAFTTLMLPLAPASAHEAHERAAEPPADSPLRFVPPAPGSYELPAIDRVAEHRLLDSDGAPSALPGLAPGQLALVSFLYTHCPEACPQALAVFQRLDRTLAGRDDLRGRVRLVSVSFDPARDTPARLAELRAQLRPAGDWRFLTAAAASGIAPVLADFGQDALTLVDAEGHDTGLLRHVLKVFLVDEHGGVRNVYSTGFLSPELLLADVQTLLLENGAPGRRP